MNIIRRIVKFLDHLLDLASGMNLPADERAEVMLRSSEHPF